MSAKKPLAPTSRPKPKAAPQAPPKPAPAATVSKAALHPVFVYGSLKRGFRLHEHYLAEQMFVGTGVIEGFTMFSLGQYPAMMFTGNPKHSVVGEYYLVTEEVFLALKRMEERAGYDTITVKGNFHTGDIIPTSNDATFSAKAWVYFCASEGMKKWDTYTDKSGDWLLVSTVNDPKQQENKES